MSKVDIKDLENIVLEGGGAKGAAYAGAIKAIEMALKQRYDRLANPTAPLTDLGNTKAILDYGPEVNGKVKPQIKSFAGSSAGAITSFALALGLSAKQCVEVSDYPFKNFLKDTHSGKYRMVSKEGKISIGEDHRSLLGQGDETRNYRFKLDKKQVVLESVLKSQIRKLILDAVFNTLIAGLLENLPFLQNALIFVQNTSKSIGNWFKNLVGLNTNESNPNDPGNPFKLSGIAMYGVKVLYHVLVSMKLWPVKKMSSSSPASPQVFGYGNASAGPQNALLNMWWNRGAGWVVSLLFTKLKRDTGMNIGKDAIGNLIWDRGMFSGFAVREFFYEVMLYACFHDTHFQRSLFTEEECKLLNAIKFDIQKGRLKSDFTSLPFEIRNKLEGLPNMTFEEFYKETGIDLIMCVSNYSTDEPIYFSQKASPKFPVIEAVGGSMSIPPAIKPVYTEMDVVDYGAANHAIYNMDPVTFGKKRGSEENYFNFQQYQLDAVAIKMKLAEMEGITMSDNNPMSYSGFLMLLMKFVTNPELNRGFNQTVVVDGVDVPLTYEHFVFHYNVAYKGLLMDGGYRCNIPYNVYRSLLTEEKDEDGVVIDRFKKTVAIKLDDTFPKQWITRIYNILSDNLKAMGPVKQLTKEQRGLLGKLLHANFRLIFKNQNAAAQGQLLDFDDISLLDRKSFEKIAVAIAELHEKMTQKHLKPWNKDKPIFALAGEGYSYGSESGQIRFLSDHEQIIPVFSYGITCYDFDMEEIRDLISLAKAKAELQVGDYFEIKHRSETERWD
jgi:predicted acylesterase/phospholipase RssA